MRLHPFVAGVLVIAAILTACGTTATQSPPAASPEPTQTPIPPTVEAASAEPAQADTPVNTEPVYVTLFCNCAAKVSRQDNVYFNLNWRTLEEDQARQVSEVTHVEILVDGQTIALDGNWHPDVLDSGNAAYPYMRSWRLPYDLSTWDIGVHHIESHFIFDAVYTDGVTNYAPGDMEITYVDLEVTE